MNKLKPKAVPKITTKGGGFALRENVNAFCNAARKYGVPDNELFQTVDLFEKKNIAQVTLAIHSLGRQVKLIFYSYYEIFYLRPLLNQNLRLLISRLNRLNIIFLLIFFFFFY